MFAGRKLAAGVVLLMATAALALGADKVTLRLRLKKGDVFHVRVGNDQTITQTLQGRTMKMVQAFVMGYTYDVAEVDPAGLATIRVTYTSVVFKQQGPTGTVAYDSANPPKTVPLAARTWAALVGQGFTMKILPTGHVKEITGVDQMMNKMIAALEIPDGPQKTMVRNQLSAMFGDEALTEMMENMMAIYPEGPVGIGDSWNKKVSITKGFPMTLDTTYTLKERKDGVATVAVTSKVSSNPQAPPMEMGFMKIRYDLKGTQTGTLRMDEANGWTDAATLSQNFSGTVHVEKNPRMPRGMSWPISLVGTINLSRGEPAPAVKQVPEKPAIVVPGTP